MWLGVSLQMTAQVSDDQTVRFFMASGEMIDLNATMIDSITHHDDMQLVWMPDTCLRIYESEIDSVVYMSPVLRLSASVLNFGKIAVGYERTMTATLTNTGDYPESFMLMGDNNFLVKAQGRELTLGAGRSVDIELTFSPTDSISYNGWFILSSHSIAEGKLRIPLSGQGIHSAIMEEDADEPPAEQTFNIVIPEDTTPEELEEFKIINIYGEFPANLASQVRGARRVMRAGEPQYMCYAEATASQAGPQFHSLVDRNNYPWLHGISLPGGQCEISHSSTAVSLLMSTPYLITNSTAEYNNTVKLLYKLESFDGFVEGVRAEYKAAMREHRTPDYSTVSPFPVFNELYEMTKDNSWLTLGGISIRDLKTSAEKVTLRLHNDFKRNSLMFPSAVNMNDANLVVTERKDLYMTFNEVIEKILDFSMGKIVDSTWKEFMGKEDDEGILMLAGLQEILSEIAHTSLDDDPNPEYVPFPLPYLIESGSTDYFDIVWDWAFNENQDKSIFEWDSEELEFNHDGFDKVCLDIYGLGLMKNKKWADYSPEDKQRIVLSFIYGGYKNIAEPLWKLIAGVSKMKKASQGKIKLDLRYGSHKAPVLAFIAKLTHDFIKERKNVTKLIKSINDGEFKEAAKQLVKFVVMKFPTKLGETSDDDHCSYINLLYNIIKKTGGITGTSEEFKELFKSSQNTIVSTINFISKTIEVCENAVDLLGSANAILQSEVKQTFLIDTEKKSGIVVTEPTACYTAPEANVHFAWRAYKGQYYGTWVYDLEMMTETISELKRSLVLKDITDTQCDYNVASLPGAANAVRIFFRIIAHQPEERSAVYTMTEMIPLVIRPEAVKEGPTMVDLGLPSGTLWAECNLGAMSRYDMGNYYAWGEIKGFDDGKNSFSWKNYRWCSGSPDKLTKYCTRKSHGKVDNKKTLEAADDLAKSSFGYFYSIPTREDWEELRTCCTWMWRVDDNFVLVRGPNGNNIILPMTGYRSGLNIYDCGTEGQYWSSTLDESSPEDAWYFHVKNAKGVPNSMNSYYRCQGRSIRPVMHNIGTLPPLQE
jgi:hypothetical protein